jgi:hypothetical protein
MVNDSTNKTNTNNIISPQLIEHKKITTYGLENHAISAYI